VRVKGSSVRLEAQTAGDRADRLSSAFGGALPGEIIGDIQISGTVEASTGDVAIVTPYGSLKATPASSIIAQGNIGIWAGQDAETGAMLSRGTDTTTFDFNPTDSALGDGDYNLNFVKDITGIWVQAVGDTTIKGAVTAFSDIRINDDIAQTGGAVTVQATLDALDKGQVPGGFVRDVVERVTPSIMLGRREGLTRVDEFETRHVIETGSQLLSRSSAIADRVERTQLAIVGLTYRLADGRVTLREHLGDIGE
jgi:hypothetical protein